MTNREYVQQMDSYDLAETFIVSTSTCIDCRNRPNDILQSISCKECVKRWLDQDDTPEEEIVKEVPINMENESAEKTSKIKEFFENVKEFIKSFYDSEN